MEQIKILIHNYPVIATFLKVFGVLLLLTGFLV